MTLRISPSMVSRLSGEFFDFRDFVLLNFRCFHPVSFSILFAGDEFIQASLWPAWLFLVAEGRIGIAKQSVDQRVKRIDLDGFLEHAARVREILGCMINAAQLHIGIDVIRIYVERLLTAAALRRSDSSRS